MSSNTTSIELQKTTKISKFESRIHEIDFFRGLLILFVIIDHILYQFMFHSSGWFNVTGIQFWQTLHEGLKFYWESEARMIVRWVILGLFCFVSGISCAFSRNNWKRAAETLVLAVIIAVGSNILEVNFGSAETHFRIDHNIIMVLGECTLLYCFFQNKNWKWLMYATLGFFIFSTIVVPILYGLPKSKDAYVPILWEPNYNGPNAQADFVPLFPYIVCFFIGAMFSKLIYADKKSLFKRHESERAICFLGRHTLIIYLCHYLILMGLFALIDVIVGV